MRFHTPLIPVEHTDYDCAFTTFSQHLFRHMRVTLAKRLALFSQKIVCFNHSKIHIFYPLGFWGFGVLGFWPGFHSLKFLNFLYYIIITILINI